jgi:hypothetical protein
VVAASVSLAAPVAAGGPAAGDGGAGAPCASSRTGAGAAIAGGEPSGVTAVPVPGSPCGAAGAAFTVVAVTTIASKDSIPAMVRFPLVMASPRKTPADPDSCNEKANSSRAF